MLVNDTKNKLHLIRPCSDTALSVCNFTDVSYGNPAQCVASAAKNLTLPGEICNVNADCRSSVCNSGICKGKAFNTSCTEDQDCDVGLFCHSGTCEN
jgi:hypothetical protein